MFFFKKKKEKKEKKNKTNPIYFHVSLFHFISFPFLFIHFYLFIYFIFPFIYFKQKQKTNKHTGPSGRKFVFFTSQDKELWLSFLHPILDARLNKEFESHQQEKQVILKERKKKEMNMMFVNFIFTFMFIFVSIFVG